MHKKTRYFLLGSVSILVIGLVVGLVAHYGGLGMRAASAVSLADAELAYVPADASVVAFADVQSVMASQFRQHLREVLPDEDRGQDRFRETTGIDIEQDIHRVLACMLGGPSPDERSGFALLRGTFDQARIEALALSHEATLEEYRGVRCLKAPEGEGHTPFLAFIEPGLLAIGDERGVKAAIDRRRAGGDFSDNPRLKELVDSVDAGATAWAVGRVDALAAQAHLPDGVSSQLPAIDWFSAASRINGGVSGTLTAQTRDEQAAENLRQVVQGFIALARMQTESRPELGAALQSLQMGGTGRTVSLSFALPAELLETLAQSRPRAGAN